MSYAASVFYNNNYASTSLHAYSVDVYPAYPKAPVTGALASQGINMNRRIRYVGVFSTRREALAAVLAYVDAPCRLWDVWNEHGGSIVMTDTARKARDWQNTPVTALASRTPQGVFISDKA